MRGRGGRGVGQKGGGGSEKWGWVSVRDGDLCQWEERRTGTQAQSFNHPLLTYRSAAAVGVACQSPSLFSLI